MCGHVCACVRACVRVCARVCVFVCERRHSQSLLNRMGLGYETVLKDIWQDFNLSPPSPTTMAAYQRNSALLSATAPQMQPQESHAPEELDPASLSSAAALLSAQARCSQVEKCQLSGFAPAGRCSHRKAMPQLSGKAPAKRKSTPPPCAHDAATGKLRRLERQETVVPHGACTGCGIVRGRQCAEDWDGRRMCRFCFSQARVTNVYSYSDAAFKEAVQRVSLERRIRQLVQDGHTLLELKVPKRFRRRGKRLALWDEKDLAEETMTLIGTMIRTLWAIEEAKDETLTPLGRYLKDSLQKYIGF